MNRVDPSTLAIPNTISRTLTLLAILTIIFFSSPVAWATPITLYESMAGNYNYVVTGGTLRNSATNQCSVTTNSVETLSGVPAGATIRSAYLYWAGSGSTPDLTVSFENQTVSFDRQFSESVGGGSPRTWFGAFADVTTLVRNKAGGPNGSYRFSGLTVDTGGSHCTIATVLAGWGLLVIYEDTANEPQRVINIFDGLQNFWGGQISLTVSNFQIPTTGIDGKFGVLTMEGDEANSGSLNGFTERLQFNGTTLTNAPINPVQNQYNSTVSDQTLAMGRANVYGVDFDVYDISSTLSAGLTSASTNYSSGQDRVLLMLEIVSVTNTPVADLTIAKSHSGDFNVGQEGAYTIQVTNNGPSNATGTVTVTDTLPPGLTYASGSDANWTCTAAGQVVTCTASSVNLAANASLPDINLTVNVDASAASTVTNTASVTGEQFDIDLSNNTATDATNIIDTGPSSGTKQLYFYMGNAPAADRNTIQRTYVTQNTSSDISAGSAVDFLLTPALQTPLVLGSDPISVDIWLRRIPNGSGSRDVTVTLDDNGGAVGTIGTQTRTNILSTNGMQWINFTFNPIPSTPITLAAGSTIRMTLTNASSSGSLRARSFRSGRRSQIAFDTSTVINVDSVAAYTNMAYPNGTVQSSYTPNNDVRIRAAVSDPFGHNDITSATITIIDPNNNSVVVDAPMTEVDPLAAAPPAATKTYEYPFTIPAGPNGTWRAMVTANEGSEGTISDLGMGTFLVGVPNIVISKSVSTISNPVEGATNAHAIPGAIIQYDIVVTNTGIGPADPNSIIITDPLPDDLRLVLNNPVQPVTFIDGDTYGQSACGMTFAPLDVGDASGPFNAVALSNAYTGAPGFPPFLAPGDLSQDADGVDDLIDKINYIRLNPKGTLAGSTGGPAPSCTFRFMLRLQ